MGRITLILLALLLILCSCTPAATTFEQPLTFFYPAMDTGYGNDDSYIQGEIREGANLGSDLIVILNSYLQGPIDIEGYQNPFPANTQVIFLSVEEQILDITLSRGFSALSGLDLTLACASLTMTCTQIADVPIVRIRANGTTLEGRQYIEMSRSSLLFTITEAETE